MYTQMNSQNPCSRTKVHGFAIERPNGVVREKDERNVPLFPIFFPATPRRKRMETHGTVQQVGLGVTVQKHVHIVLLLCWRVV